MRVDLLDGVYLCTCEVAHGGVMRINDVFHARGGAGSAQCSFVVRTQMGG